MLAKVLRWDAEEGQWKRDVIEIPPEPKPVAAEAGPHNVVKVMMAQELKQLLGIGIGGFPRAGGGGGGPQGRRQESDHAHSRGQGELSTSSRLGNGGGKDSAGAGKAASKRSRRGHHQPGQLAGKATANQRHPPNPPAVKVH